MRAAFASTLQAVVFALLLLVLLLLPVLMGKSWLPPRGEIYSSVWWRMGPYPYIYHEIFEEKGDIDVAFVGSSHVLHGIDTPYVQEKLSEQLGRQAVVRTLAWGGAGYDALYFITRDLLTHRKVHMLVFYDEFRGYNQLNSLAPRWFRWSESMHELIGLPLQRQAAFYYAAILGMPRNLLSLVRPNIPASLTGENYCETFYRAPNPAERMGSIAAKLGFDLDSNANNPNFVAFTPRTVVQPADVSIYTPETRNQFSFSSAGVPGWQLFFARKFAALCRKNNTRLVMIEIPELIDPSEMRAPFIAEKKFWPAALNSNVAMVGIPEGKLFAGLTDEEVLKLFFNPGHLNKNGQEYFTPLITPALIKLYAGQKNL